MMKAQEIRDGIWTIPGDRMKNSMPHRVPVTEMIRAGLAMGNQKGERLVFSASPSGEAPLSLDSPRLKIVKIIKREGDGSWDPINLPRLVCHDRVPDAVAEKCLSHTWGDATVQAYFRTDLLDRRREVMRRWAETLMPAPWEL